MNDNSFLLFYDIYLWLKMFIQWSLTLSFWAPKKGYRRENQPVLEPDINYDAKGTI